MNALKVNSNCKPLIVSEYGGLDRTISEGEELTVNYGLPLHLAPEWYRLCHHRHLAGAGRL